MPFSSSLNFLSLSPHAASPLILFAFPTSNNCSKVIMFGCVVIFAISDSENAYSFIGMALLLVNNGLGNGDHPL